MKRSYILILLACIYVFSYAYVKYQECRKIQIEIEIEKKKGDVLDLEYQKLIIEIENLKTIEKCITSPKKTQKRARSFKR